MSLFRRARYLSYRLRNGVFCVNSFACECAWFCELWLLLPFTSLRRRRDPDQSCLAGSRRLAPCLALRTHRSWVCT